MYKFFSKTKTDNDRSHSINIIYPDFKKKFTFDMLTDRQPLKWLYNISMPTVSI